MEAYLAVVPTQAHFLFLAVIVWDATVWCGRAPCRLGSVCRVPAVRSTCGMVVIYDGANDERVPKDCSTKQIRAQVLGSMPQFTREYRSVLKLAAVCKGARE